MEDEKQEPKEQGIVAVQQTEEPSLAARHVSGVPPARAYAGASLLAVSPEARKVLADNREVPDDDLEVKPDDGAVYAPHSWYEQKLTEAFGHGSWATVPGSPLSVDASGDWVYQRWILLVSNCYVSETIGQARYNASNDRTNKAVAAESARSDAIPRLCAKSSLSLGTNPWNKRFCERWRSQHAIKVKAMVWSRGQKKLVELWRRRDSEPLEGELRVQDEPDNSAQIERDDEPQQTLLPTSPVLTHVYHEESDTYEIRGPSETMKACKTVLKPYENKVSRTYAVPSQKLPDLSFELERAGVGLRPLKPMEQGA